LLGFVDGNTDGKALGSDSRVVLRLLLGIYKVVLIGILEGILDGEGVGASDGIVVGFADGFFEGIWLGPVDACLVVRDPSAVSLFIVVKLS